MRKGKVHLVGAGPGDPGLITAKGLACLGQADVIIYDHLLDERLLDAAPAGAERIYVGKTAGDHTWPQDEINQLLVNKAQEDKKVVRLKGGDPFVLGRGGEEANTLAQNHIPFEVVPGVTSATAAPAYDGIPVTYRGLASSFAVITGHEDPGKDSSSINWATLATGVDTLLFLMGMKNLSKIAAKLVEYGRPQDTPVAVIREGTRLEQKTVVGSLKNIVAKVKKQRLAPPVVIVVGEVVKLREKLRWFDNRPLFGKRILVTRAHHQSSTLSQLLVERGAKPIELPAIDIQAVTDTRELDRAISSLSSYQWLIFTSANDVKAFFQRLRSLSRDTRALSGLKIGAIGPATAKTLEAQGVIPDYIPEIYTNEGVIAGLKNWNITGQHFLLARAAIADKELAEGISRLGVSVHEVATYRTVPATETLTQARRMLIFSEIDVIIFTSSSTVSNLVATFGGELAAINNIKVACIGPKTADTASQAGLEVDIVASKQTIPELVAAIEDYFRKEL